MILDLQQDVQTFDTLTFSDIDRMCYYVYHLDNQDLLEWESVTVRTRTGVQKDAHRARINSTFQIYNVSGDGFDLVLEVRKVMSTLTRIFYFSVYETQKTKNYSYATLRKFTADMNSRAHRKCGDNAKSTYISDNEMLNHLFDSCRDRFQHERGYLSFSKNHALLAGLDLDDSEPEDEE